MQNVRPTFPATPPQVTPPRQYVLALRIVQRLEATTSSDRSPKHPGARWAWSIPTHPAARLRALYGGLVSQF